MRELGVIELLNESGQWWLADRFRDPRALRQANATDEDIEKALAILKSHFPAKQACEAFHSGYGSNTFIDRVIQWGGMVDVSPILKTAEMIKQLTSYNGFFDVLNRIKGHQTSHSAWFEMQMGFIMHSVGLHIEFPPSGQGTKSPDVTGHINGDCLAIECKILDVHQTEKWVGDYYEILSLTITQQSHSSWLPYILHLLPFDHTRLPIENERTHDNAQALATQDAHLIIEAMSINHGKKQPNILCPLAIGRFNSEAETTISHEPSSVKRAWNKIESKGIKTGARQLASAAISGLVAINTRDRPDFIEAQHRFIDQIRSQTKIFEYCSAVILIPWHNILTPQRPILLLNPYAKTSLYDLPKIQEILNQLGAIDLANAMQNQSK